VFVAEATSLVLAAVYYGVMLSVTTITTDCTGHAGADTQGRGQNLAHGTAAVVQATSVVVETVAVLAGIERVVAGGSDSLLVVSVVLLVACR
jgi:hypothetical protein